MMRLRLGVAEAARIGQPRQVSFVGVEIADGLFVGNHRDQALAAFVGRAGGKNLDALGGGGQRAVIAIQVGHAGEFLGHAPA